MAQFHFGIGMLVLLVFAGNETAISVSDKDYKVANRAIQKNDIITIDLSPHMSVTEIKLQTKAERLQEKEKEEKA